MERPTAVVLVIIDGLADIPPEATSNTRTLNRIARRGRCGLIDPVSPGLACGSDTAHLSIFGYDPHRHYRGRGAFEALGAKVPIRPGDIAFKCSFACINSNHVVTTRRPCKDPLLHQFCANICHLLNHQIGSIDNVKVMVTHAGAHRCTVKLSGEGLSDAITNTDPLLDNRPLLPCQPLHTTDQSAVRTAAIVNHLTDKIRTILNNHVDSHTPAHEVPPVNVLLMRGASMGIDLEPFQTATGLKAFLIAPTKIIAGVGRTADMDIIHVNGATGGYDTDLMSKADACVEQLLKRDRSRYPYDLGVVHVKAVDEAAHERSAEKKTYWMEQVDLMIARILRLLRKTDRNDVVLCVTGDHTSPSQYGDHTCEPVPFVICDAFDPDHNYSQPVEFVGKDDCKKFCSTEMGAKGSLGRFPGSEICPMIRRLILQKPEKKAKSHDPR